ncbi:MAG: glycosyltransferase [bacterium]
MTCARRLDRAILEDLLAEGDMLILQRVPMSPRLAKLFSALSNTGVVIVFEIDDDLLHLPSGSRFTELTTDDFSARLKQSIMCSHAVQCSTHPLAEVVSELHPEVAVLENQMEQVPRFIHKEIGDRPFIIGYAAGEDHWLDWLTVKDSYNRIIAELEEAGDKVETWIIGDRAIFESIRSDRKTYFPLLNRREYFEVLSCFDISLMPLADIQFNRSKSDIKFLESAACSCAVIASDTVYAESIVHGRTGLLFSEPHEFEKHLCELIRNPIRISHLARNAYNYVKRDRLFHQHIEKWEKTYLNWLFNRNNLCSKVPACVNAMSVF